MLFLMILMVFIMFLRVFVLVICIDEVLVLDISIKDLEKLEV